jgi:itaconyl-CoA hydratase/mesaconyl-C4 CoA hydratase
MFAGARLEFKYPLVAGAEARKVTTIIAVEEKNGRSGKLLFVTLQHEFWQGDQCCVREEQDIVYREPTPPKIGFGQPMEAGDWSVEVMPTTVMLFRYSAVTFNGHRIHYDYPYVTENERYSNLVVHGPLTATLALGAFVEKNPSAVVKAFAFRGLRPLLAPEPFQVGGRIVAPGRANIWAGDANGVGQSAEVEFG